jgi:peptidoglycan/LPS O-acetylase OafA/YrhL
LELGLLRFVPFFLAGNCAYLYREYIPWNRALGAACVLASSLSMGSLLATRFVLPIAGSYAIFWLAFSQASPLRYFSPANDISYGVYLYGWPTQKVLLWYFPRLNLDAQVLLALGIAMVLGWLSWQLIEKPCLGWKTNLSQPIYSAVRMGTATAFPR